MLLFNLTALVGFPIKKQPLLFFSQLMVYSAALTFTIAHFY